MCIARTLISVVCIVTAGSAWVIQPVAEDPNAQVSSIINNVPMDDVAFVDDAPFAERRMDEMFQVAESRQSSQQQEPSSGINQDFLPFLQALATSSDRMADPVYPQQQEQQMKQDRQGYYGGGGGHGYDGLQKDIKLGVPSIGVSIDPFRILKALLSLIPRPKLNLNGKLFFGVELGKKAGIGIGPGPGQIYG